MTFRLAGGRAAEAPTSPVRAYTRNDVRRNLSIYGIVTHRRIRK